MNNTADIVVPLMLKVADISPNYDFTIYEHGLIVQNNVGRIENGKSKITWFNINFKELLGDLYDKYDYFYLQPTLLITLAWTGGSGQYNKPFENHINTDYTSLSFYLSGLNFVNSSYSVKDNANKDYINIFNSGPQRASSGANSADPFQNFEFLPIGQQCYEDNLLYLFKKPEQHLANLTIFIGAMGLGNLEVPESVMPWSFSVMQHYVCQFNIIPHS